MPSALGPERRSGARACQLFLALGPEWHPGALAHGIFQTLNSMRDGVSYLCCLPLINRDGTSYLPDTTTSAPYVRNKSRVGTGASCPYTTYSAWGIHSNFSGLAWMESCSLSKVLCSSSLARAERSKLHNSVSTGGSHMAAWRSRATLVTRAILQRMNTNMLDGVSHISLCESVIFALVG